MTAGVLTIGHAMCDSWSRSLQHCDDLKVGSWWQWVRYPLRLMQHLRGAVKGAQICTNDCSGSSGSQNALSRPMTRTETSALKGLSSGGLAALPHGASRDDARRTRRLVGLEGTNTTTVSGNISRIGGGEGGHRTVGQVFNGTDAIPLCELEYSVKLRGFQLLYEGGKGGRDNHGSADAHRARHAVHVRARPIAGRF
jgi:hypothetical protein